MLQRPGRGGGGKSAGGGERREPGAQRQAALEPMLDKIAALPEELGKPECLLADTGYFSAANVAACDRRGSPLIAMGRQPHHPPLAERSQRRRKRRRSNAGRGDGHRLTTPAGRRFTRCASRCRSRCSEHQSALGSSILLRGLAGARGEWSLVTMAWNIKRISRVRLTRLWCAGPQTVPGTTPATANNEREEKGEEGRAQTCLEPERYSGAEGDA